MAIWGQTSEAGPHEVPVETLDFGQVRTCASIQQLLGLESTRLRKPKRPTIATEHSPCGLIVLESLPARRNRLPELGPSICSSPPCDAIPRSGSRSNPPCGRAIELTAVAHEERVSASPVV